MSSEILPLQPNQTPPWRRTAPRSATARPPAREARSPGRLTRFETTTVLTTAPRFRRSRSLRVHRPDGALERRHADEAPPRIGHDRHDGRLAAEDEEEMGKRRRDANRRDVEIEDLCHRTPQHASALRLLD